jgi:hypothetical protein
VEEGRSGAVEEGGRTVGEIAAAHLGVMELVELCQMCTIGAREPTEIQVGPESYEVLLGRFRRIREALFNKSGNPMIGRAAITKRVLQAEEEVRILGGAREMLIQYRGDV